MADGTAPVTVASFGGKSSKSLVALIARRRKRTYFCFKNLRLRMLKTGCVVVLGMRHASRNIGKMEEY